MNDILFLDTTSSGVLDAEVASKDLLNPLLPRVIAVACLLTTPLGHTVEEWCHLIKPGRNVEIDPVYTRQIGFPLPELLEHGLSVKAVISEVCNIIPKAGLMVSYDVRANMVAIDAECVHLNRHRRQWPPLYDIMANGKSFMGADDVPSFAKLYMHCFAGFVPLNYNPITTGIMRVRAIKAIYDKLSRSV